MHTFELFSLSDGINVCKSNSHTNKYITGTLNMGQPLHRGKGRKRGRKGRGSEMKGRERLTLIPSLKLNNFLRKMLKLIFLE
jgi:hypothetical protein